MIDLPHVLVCLAGDWQGQFRPALYLINQSWQVQTQPWVTISITVVLRTRGSRESGRASLHNSYLYSEPLSGTKWYTLPVQAGCSMKMCLTIAGCICFIYIFLFSVHFSSVKRTLTQKVTSSRAGTDNPDAEEPAQNRGIVRIHTEVSWTTATASASAHFLLTLQFISQTSCVLHFDILIDLLL